MVRGLSSIPLAKTAAIDWLYFQSPQTNSFRLGAEASSSSRAAPPSNVWISVTAGCRYQASSTTVLDHPGFCFLRCDWLNCQLTDWTGSL